MLLARISLPILLAALLAGKVAALDDQSTMKGAVSVKVNPTPSQAWTNPLVHITQIELFGDNLRLEIENTASQPVVAIHIVYRLAGCWSGYSSWTEGGVDTKRYPGAASIDIPAHGHAWYEHKHFASDLALTALDRKSRYLQAQGGVTTAFLADGTEISPPPDALLERETGEIVEDSNCQRWTWDRALDGVHAFQPPSQERKRLQKSGEANGVAYTCSAIDNILHCPE